MKLTELGFDYSNLSSCSIKRKNYLFAIVISILAFTFLIIFITFISFYLAELPMHINDDLVYPSDPRYENFFQIFLGVFGFISLIFVSLFVLGVLGKPKIFMILDSDQDMNQIYYIYHHSKAEEIYLTEKFAVIYNARYNSVYQEVNPVTVQELMKKFVFWKSFDSLEDVTIKHKNKKTILKSKEKSNRFVTLIKTYSFYNDGNILPYKVTEMVNLRTGGNYRTQSMYTYYFEDINRKQQLDIHPEIKKTLSQVY